MRPALSPNTQAILLLTAPLLAGQGASSSDLMPPSEYKRLARHLRERQCEPADLLAPDVAELLRACQSVIEEGRLRRLLGRGFLLSQAIERWQARAIWVTSHADADYPRRLKVRLRDDAPAVLYGCGDPGLLEAGGLAVVGSRNAEDILIAYATNVGRLAAKAGRTLVSGGARGIDRAAMLGALEEGGKVIGVLADGLEKGAMNREHRNVIIQGQMVLISPYDPGAGFNVGNAMQRNKLIYALADASLVVSSDFNKGGTWAGATEQLDKLRMAPVYVRSSAQNSAGIDALLKKGAIPWPDPQDADGLKTVFDVAMPTAPDAIQDGLSLFSTDVPPARARDAAPDPQSTAKKAAEISLPSFAGPREDPPMAQLPDNQRIVAGPEAKPEEGDRLVPAAISPADTLFAAAREAIQRLLIVAMKPAEIAAALEVSMPQAKAWLQRLVDEGILERKRRPDRYVAKQSRLFE
jgi:DNA processing protein